LIAVDLWAYAEAAKARLSETLGGALPALRHSAPLEGGWRAIRVEPTAWWLTGPLADLKGKMARLEAALAVDGGAIDLTGAFTTITVRGAAWRELLMFGGVFDAEGADFGPGRTAGTLLHHASVRYDVIDHDEVRILAAPSYAEDLLHHLRVAAARLEPAGP
jgi:heterotetrameric sarcosine oxidase gamma subunit